MNTQDLLAKIAKYKSAMESESDEDTKKKFQSRIEQLEKDIAQAEAAVEKKEDKIEKEEDKAMEEAEKKLRRYKDAMESETDPDTKAKFQKRIDDLEEQLKGVKKQIAEEKKEIQEQKKDIKEAVDEVQSAQKAVRTQAIKKGKTQATARAQITKKKTARKKAIVNIISKLDKLIDKNPKLKAKYSNARGGSYGQYSKVDLKRDAGRPSKPFGYRFKGKNNTKVPRPDQRGQANVYYEGRANRADVFPRRKYKLMDGGDVSGHKMANGGIVNLMDSGFDLYQNDSYTLSGQPNPLIFGQYENMNDFRNWVENTLWQRGAVMKEDNKTGYTHLEIDDHKISIDNEYSMIFFEGSKESLEYVLNILIEEANKMADGGMMANGGDDELIKRLKEKYKKFEEAANVEKDEEVQDKLYSRMYEIKEMIDEMEKSNVSKMAGGGMAKRKPRRKMSTDVLILNIYDTALDWKINTPKQKEFDSLKEAKAAGEKENAFEYEVIDAMTGETVYSTYAATGEHKHAYKKGGQPKKQGYDDREDERLAMKHGKTAEKDLVGKKSKKEKSRRDDAGFEVRKKKGGPGRGKKNVYSWKPEAKGKVADELLKKTPTPYLAKKYADLVIVTKP